MSREMKVAAQFVRLMNDEQLKETVDAIRTAQLDTAEGHPLETLCRAAQREINSRE